jgi:hypothetical protein
LEENVAIATEFKALDRQELKRISALTESYARNAMWFKRGARG